MDASNIKASSDLKVQCMICLDDQAPVYAHGPCNHIVHCGVCYLLHKMKYDKNTCVLCAEPIKDPIVIALSDSLASYLDYNFASYGYSRRIGCYFHDRQMMKLYESKLNFTCSQCSVTYGSMHELKRHASEHNKEYCNICVAKRKVFPVDQRLYMAKDLAKHRLTGDPPIDMDGAIPAHIKCNLCREWSYDRDDYVHHMIMSHHCCQLCKRRGTEVWLLGQPELIAHYASDHLICDFEDCCAKPLENVYDDEISLQSHILTIHGKSVTKQERKAAARLNIDFAYARPGTSSASTSARISHQVSSSTSLRPSTSTSSLSDISSFPVSISTSSAKISSATSSSRHSNDVISELKQLLGDEFPSFQAKCILYFNKELPAMDFYDDFCCRLLRFPSAPLLWIQLVDSLRDYQLREELHRAHHDAVKLGRGLNRKPAAPGEKKSTTTSNDTLLSSTSSSLLSSNDPRPQATLHQPAASSARGPAIPRNLWEPLPSSNSAAMIPTTTASARPKAKGPSKGSSVWAASTTSSPPTTSAASASRPATTSSQSSQPHLTSAAGWPREAFSMADFPKAFGKKKAAKPLGPWAAMTASATSSASSLPTTSDNVTTSSATMTPVEETSSKKKGRSKKVLMQIGLRLNG